MTAQSRQTKVLVALLISIVLCTMILNVLGHNPPSAGAFCLSQYYRLVPVEKLVRSREVQRPRYWKWIEIYYSEGDSDVRVTSGLNIQVELSGSLSSVSGQQDIDCHFIIYNGHNDLDGKIEPTEQWNRQLPVNRPADNNRRRARQNEQTIYISIVTNGQNHQPTNIQIKRLYVLVEELCRELNIKSESVLYPDSWQY
ncbi:MAG: hypothetical protein A2Z38_02660 [Planctomycetes bacterium RBG_19FT_COMBO_48_8]|nr:MAG: hypothetical protein A2Z38_02660 [Planctomycetes bacterium RBG_19FT_COMBO_48_8]